MISNKPVRVYKPVFLRLAVRIAAILTILAVVFTNQISFTYAETIASSSYYVSQSGSNSNPGTLSQPWKTLAYAAPKLHAGDILYIRGGTYQEYFSIVNSGTQSSPILITNYNDETVVIDGMNNTLPQRGSGTPLITVYGDWVTVRNLTFQFSGTLAAYSIGSHVTFDNLYVHHNWGGGVILSGNYDTIQNSRIWYNSTMNENGKSTSGNGTGVSCARYPDYCTIRGSTVWENWGEGISTFEALHTTIEDNITYNNQQNIYISDTRYATVQRNISYCTPGNSIDSYEAQNGILIGDEKGVPIPLGPSGTRYPSSNNTFINNLIMGCNHNLYSALGVSTNNLYAYNTFVNAGGDTSEHINIIFYTGTATNARFMNNIIVQEDSWSLISAGGTGMTYTNNLWSKTPPSAASSAADVVGNPLLAKASRLTPGVLNSDYFRILPGSPAIGRAKAISSILTDYFVDIRDQFNPDIGAIELGSTDPEPNPAPQLQFKLFMPFLSTNR